MYSLRRHMEMRGRTVDLFEAKFILENLNEAISEVAPRSMDRLMTHMLVIERQG